MRLHIAAAILLTALSVLPARAETVRAGDIVVEAAWARASAGRMPTGAAYLTLRSLGGADRLAAVATDAAERAELHTHVMDGQVMKMRPVDAVEIPAGETVRMGPGSFHIMLIGLKAPLTEGGTLPLTLTFEKAGEVAVTADILGPGSRGPAGHQSGGHGSMGGMGPGK